MKKLISNSLLNQLPTTGKKYEVWDERLPGFYLTVTAKGSKNYRCFYRLEGHKKHHTIGNAEKIKASEAREQARIILGNIAKGLPPKQEKKQPCPTFRNFFNQTYAPWRKTNRKDGKADTKRIETVFLEPLGDKLLSMITLKDIDDWTTASLERGLAESTINRDLGRLHAMLNKAVKWEIIEENPISEFEFFKIDKHPIVRYLGSADAYQSDVENTQPSERERLFKAIMTYEAKKQAGRDSGNEWRKQRGKELYPLTKSDHMRPMIFLSINTGIRKGEMFSLRWEQINFKTRLLTILGSKTKNSKTRHISLNDFIIKELIRWQAMTGNTQGLVFPNAKGEQFTDIKRAWTAIKKIAFIEDFRWHDLRHTFASDLVMAGVSLKAVKELMGHADIAMTERYAHLAPEYKAEAVSKLPFNCENFEAKFQGFSVNC